MLKISFDPWQILKLGKYNTRPKTRPKCKSHVEVMCHDQLKAVTNEWRT